MILQEYLRIYTKLMDSGNDISNDIKERNYHM